MNVGMEIQILQLRIQIRHLQYAIILVLLEDLAAKQKAQWRANSKHALASLSVYTTISLRVEQLQPYLHDRLLAFLGA